MNEKIQKKLKLLPKHPGVYIMKDETGEIIYVGKAISLKSRVSQYFVGFDKHLIKVQAMISNIDDFDYILCESEMEALILESNLIKQYMPKYNIMLKDDKHYPYIRIDMKEKYPRIEIVRRLKKDGAKYYGPYLNAGGVRNILDKLFEIYPIRTCRKDLSTGKKDLRPCLNYQLGRCLGPCALDVLEEDYLLNLQQVIAFLDGKTRTVKDILTDEMMDYSQHLEYEQAGRIKELLDSIDEIIQGQNASITKMEDRDIIGISTGGTVAVVQVFMMRRGKMIGSKHYRLEIDQQEEKADIISAFLMQYYDMIEKIPREILLPLELDDQKLIEEHLCSLIKTELITPKIGQKKQMVLMANKNANEQILKIKNNRQWQKTKGAMIELAGYLDIDTDSRRLECFDISNTQGTDSVASMVVFIDGEPAKKEYRRFKIKTVEGPDDFASMKEVLTRRFLRAIEGQRAGEEGGFAELPDLLVIDGGKGQLAMAVEVLKELRLSSIPVCGLAEKLEDVFVPNQSEPVAIPKKSNAQFLLQRLRDEAHRFALTFHKALRSKRTQSSKLDLIPGVGPKRRQILFTHFKSIEAIKAASLDELYAVSGIDKKTAKSVYDFFQLKEEK